MIARRALVTGVAALPLLPSVGVPAEVAGSDLLQLEAQRKAILAHFDTTRDMSDEEISTWCERQNRVDIEMVTRPVRTITELGIIAEVAKSYLEDTVKPLGERYYLEEKIVSAFFERIEELARATA